MNKRKKTLYVQTTGGICNRLNNIINGFYYYEIYKFEQMYIVWPKNHNLNCNFSECFQTQDTFEVIDKGGPHYKEIEDAKGGDGVIDLRKNPHQARRMKRNRSFIIRSPMICSNIPPPYINEIINNQMPIPAPDLCSRIEDFLIKNDLKKNKYIGVHIRRTDESRHPDKLFTKQIKEALKKNKNQKFFVCSDNSSVESKLHSQFPSNVIIRPKEHQPVALTDRQTFGKVTYTPDIHNKLKFFGLPGHKGRGIYNIYRPPEAVVEGVIDLFLLAQASRVITSNGTFSQLAELMSKYRSPEKICFLTTIIANSYKEADKPPKFKRYKNCDYFLFTNLDPSLFDTSWTVRRIENEHIDSCPSNIIKSRYIKFMAWEYLQKVMGKSYDAIVYCDGIYTPRLNFNWRRLVEDVKIRGLVQKKHRRCAMEEYSLLLKRGRKDSPQRIKGAITWLNSHHFPKRKLMTENCFFAYDPDNTRVTSAFKSFWDLFITDIINRDQPLWSYFLWKRKLKPLILSDKRWKNAFAPIGKKSIGFNKHRYK